MLAIDGLDVAAPIFKRARRQPPRIDFTGENKRNILAASPVPGGPSSPVLARATPAAFS